LNIEICEQIQKVNQNNKTSYDAFESFEKNHQDVSDIFSALLSSNLGTFQQWIKCWPLLQLWINSESYSHSIIHSNAELEGMIQELYSNLEIKNSLQVESAFVKIVCGKRLFLFIS